MKPGRGRWGISDMIDLVDLVNLGWVGLVVLGAGRCWRSLGLKVVKME